MIDEARMRVLAQGPTNEDAGSDAWRALQGTLKILQRQVEKMGKAAEHKAPDEIRSEIEQLPKVVLNLHKLLSRVAPLTPEYESTEALLALMFGLVEAEPAHALNLRKSSAPALERLVKHALQLKDAEDQSLEYVLRTLKHDVLPRANSAGDRDISSTVSALEKALHSYRDAFVELSRQMTSARNLVISRGY
jgi:hypothetical protein